MTTQATTSGVHIHPRHLTKISALGCKAGIGVNWPMRLNFENQGSRYYLLTPMSMSETCCWVAHSKIKLSNAGFGVMNAGFLPQFWGQSQF